MPTDAYLTPPDVYIRFHISCYMKILPPRSLSTSLEGCYFTSLCCDGVRKRDSSLSPASSWARKNPANSIIIRKRKSSRLHPHNGHNSSRRKMRIHHRHNNYDCCGDAIFGRRPVQGVTLPGNKAMTMPATATTIGCWNGKTWIREIMVVVVIRIVFVIWPSIPKRTL